eukprot:3391853-Rhodomonas_salina.5
MHPHTYTHTSNASSLMHPRNDTNCLKRDARCEMCEGRSWTCGVWVRPSRVRRLAAHAVSVLLARLRSRLARVRLRLLHELRAVADR